jgi:hypothetical protein
VTGLLAHLVRRTITPTADVQPRRSNPFDPVQVEPHAAATRRIEGDSVAPDSGDRHDTLGKYATSLRQASHHAEGIAAKDPGDDSPQSVSAGALTTAGATAHTRKAGREQTPTPLREPESSAVDAARVVRADNDGDSIWRRQSSGVGTERAAYIASAPLQASPTRVAARPHTVVTSPTPDVTLEHDLHNIALPVAAGRSDPRAHCSLAATARSSGRGVDSDLVVEDASSDRFDSAGSLASWPTEARHRQGSTQSDSIESRSSTREPSQSPSSLATVIAPRLRPVRSTPGSHEGSTHTRRGESGPTVHVTIGTIEVRAVTTPGSVSAQPSKRSTPAKPTMSLTDYLEQRRGGRR